MFKLSIKQVGAVVPPPSPPLSDQVEIWRDHAGGVYAYAETLGEDCWMHLPGLASFRFSPNDSEVAASVSHDVAEEAVVDAYRRRVLPMAFQVGGREVLHASAVRSPAGVTALCGVSQTGKSTIAFGLSGRGYELWGDDAFVFEIDEGQGKAIWVPFEIRLRPAAATWFEQRPVAPERGAASSQSGLPQHSPIAAICILRQTEDLASAVTVRQLPFADAFTNLLSHASWFTLKSDEHKRRVINHYLDLASQTPVYDVSFQRGLDNLPDILDAIEAVMPRGQEAA